MTKECKKIWEKLVAMMAREVDPDCHVLHRIGYNEAVFELLQFIEKEIETKKKRKIGDSSKPELARD